MYGVHSGRVQAVLERLGKDCEYLTRTVSSEDGFGNPEENYIRQTDSEGNPVTITAFRTYPNRNTETGGSGGSRVTDNPVVLMPLEDALEETSRIEYPEPVTGSITKYELTAATNYDTHVEFIAEVVINE